MSFNDDQIDYIKSLARIADDKRCYCAWFPLGECPHCPPGKTLADRLKLQCSSCGSYPPAALPDQPVAHRIGCTRRVKGEAKP